MGKEQIMRILKSANIYLQDATRQAIQDSIEEECIVEKNKQEHKDIVKAIMALCDIGVEEEKLYEFLYNYFGINDRSEAEKYIREGKNIKFPFRKLREYLTEQGYTNSEMREFMEVHNVREKLENNVSLSELSTEELKDIVEGKEL